MNSKVTAKEAKAQVGGGGASHWDLGLLVSLSQTYFVRSYGVRPEPRNGVSRVGVNFRRRADDGPRAASERPHIYRIGCSREN